ncbi:MAG: hypothetical protein AAGH89_07775 [Verrucomicrobiota bacterium]
MSILKRFEVWMLLVFVTAGIGFVLFTHQSAKNQTDDEEFTVLDPIDAEPEAPFAIETAKLIQDDAEHWLLELQVRYRNSTEDELKLISPDTTLKTESGLRVPDFFLPFSPPPVIAPEAEQVVDLRYWLDTRHHDQPLWLSIFDEEIKVEVTK